MNNGKIDFFIIGAQKCATTWLYNCLNEHPDVFIGGEKREVNYLGGDRYKEKGESWFFSQFNEAKDHQLLGSASVDYLIDIDSINYIKENNSRAKFILSIRNPIDRFISAYFWLSRNNLIDDLALNEGIEKIIDSYSGSNNESNGYDYIIQRGLYYNQLKHFLKEFPEENFKLIVFDDIKETPDKVLEDLYTFLGVDNNFNPLSKSRKPKGNSYNNFLVNIERKLPDNKFFKKGISFISELIKLASISKDKFSDVENKYLERFEEIYEADVHQMINIVKKLPPESRPISGTSHLEKWF